jgi:hypothetical protein
VRQIDAPFTPTIKNTNKELLMSDNDVKALNLTGKWDEWAKMADKHKKGNKDNVMLNSAFEKQYVLEQARKAGFSDEDIKTALKNSGMSENIVNEIFEVDLSNTKNKSAYTRQSKDSRTSKENALLNSFSMSVGEFSVNKDGTLSNTIQWENLVNSFIDRSYATSDNNALVAQARTVAMVIKDLPQDSRASINKLYDAALEKLNLKSDDVYADFKKRVLTNFVILAEKHQMAKETEKLNNEFTELRTAFSQTDAVVKTVNKFPELKAKYDEFAKQFTGADGKVDSEKLNNSMEALLDGDAKAYYQKLRTSLSRKDAYESIKKNPEFKGSYYHDYKTRTQEERLVKDKEYGAMTVKVHKGMIHKMEDTILLEDARKDVYDAIWSLRGRKDVVKSRQVESEAKKVLGDKLDKYAHKVLGDKLFSGEMSLQERVGFQRSLTKDLRKAVAAYNRVMINKEKEWSPQDFYNVLDDKSVFDALMNVDDKNPNKSVTKLITQNPNKTLNISNLEDLINDVISRADNRANAEGKEYQEYDEVQLVANEIYTKTGVKISKKDAGHLIDLCGFDRDKKNVGFYFLAAYKGTIGGIAATLSSLAAALTVSTAAGAVTATPSYRLGNLDAVNQKILNTEFPLTIDINNPVNVDLVFKVNVVADGAASVSSSINRSDILYQFAKMGFTADEVGFEQVADGSWHLWVHKPSMDPYSTMAAIKDVLGNNYDFSSDIAENLEVQQDVDVDQADPETDRTKGFLIGMAVGMALSILKECLKELPATGAIMNNQISAENFAEFERELETYQKLTPNVRQALKLIALEVGG